jgi:hypothetical protein
VRGITTMIAILLLSMICFSSAEAYRPVVDPSLSYELSKSQGERYKIEGRVWVANERDSIREPFATFNKVDGNLFVAPLMGVAEAHGFVRVDMSAFFTREAFLEGRIRRDLLQLRRYPQAFLKIFDVAGLVTHPAGVVKYGLGRLKGELELLGKKHWLDLPVRVHRFSDNSFGLEPTAALYLTMDELGVGDSFRSLNVASGNRLSNSVKLLFRFDVSRV